MKFETVTESFNYWNNRSLNEIEERAAQLKGQIESDPDADITSINIEIEGLNGAKANKQAIAKANEAPAERANLWPLDSFNITEKRYEKAVDSPEYRSAFYKTLLGKELTLKEKSIYRQAQQESRSDEFSTSENTPAVIPTETLNEIVSKARAEGGLISVCRNFAIPANLAIPVATPVEKAGWHAEGVDVDRQKPEIESVKFDAREILKVFSISAKVRAMSVSSLESYLTEELAHSVFSCIADSLVNGTGSDEGEGVLNISETDENRIKVTGDVTYKDIVNLISLLKRGYQSNAMFFMNNHTLYQSIYSVTDTNERPIFILDAQNERVGHILGYPVVLDDYIEDGKIIFGNPDFICYNMPQSITVESSTQSSFTSGRVDYRALCIADCKPIVEEAFVFMNITASEAARAEDLKGVVKIDPTK